MAMKIGSVEMENDPAQALKDFQTAMERVDALPASEQKNLTMVRLRGMVERKEANALEEIGRYREAMAIFDREIAVSRKMVDADPLDERSLVDLDVVLDDEAGSYDDAATPVLAAASADPDADRRRNLEASKRLYAETIVILERLLKLNPANERWKTYRAYAQVKVGTMGQELHESGDGAGMSREGMDFLRATALKPDASAMALDDAGSSAIAVEPVALRDSALAVTCAERGVAMSHRQTASALESLARAYRAAGQVDKARAAAKEGLALLPAVRTGEPKSRVRKLLEYQLR